MAKKAKNKAENAGLKEEKEKVVCKECGKKYLASLNECPYCEQKKATKKKEGEIDEDEEDDVIEDYDDEEVVTKKELNMNVDKDGNIYETVVTNPSKEFKDIKILLYVTIVICVITLLVSFITLSNVSGSSTSSSSSSDTTDEEDDDTSTVDYDVSMFTEITSSEFIDLFDLDDDTIYFVYTGRSDCSYCQSFLPYLQESVEEYDYTLYYLDINGVTSDEATEIEELDDTLEADFTYTPMVFAIKNGEVIDVNEGYTEYETYTSFLEDNDVSAK